MLISAVNSPSRGSWESVLLPPTASIAQAIQRLDDASLRVVIIVDADRKVVGTVTDGDVRRALINQVSMEDQVATIMNRSPVTVNSKCSRSEMLEIMRRKDILQVPIINCLGVIVGLETIYDLSGSDDLPNPVVLMAGGFGKRLQPLTNSIPKPMLKVGGTPILEIIVDQLAKSGLRSIFLSVHFQANLIKDYFQDGQRWGVQIRYLEEQEPLGTAGALSLLPEDIGNAPVLIMNGDVLTRVDFQEFIRYHNEQQSDITVGIREYEFQIPYGVITVDHSQLRSITEKPVHSEFVNAGIYVINQCLLKHVGRGVRTDMTDLIEMRLAENKKVSAFPIHEYWIDIGRIEEFERANADMQDSIS